MPLSLANLVQISGVLTNTAADLATPSAAISWGRQINLDNGTGLNQADKIYLDTATLGPSATANVDLAGSLTDILGAALTFVRVKALFVAALAANTNDVQVTRPAANGWPLFLAAGDGISVRPGGVFAWVDPTAVGIAVTAGTGDLLTFTNSAAGTPVTYDVVIVGGSA
jgi:hypothetical protein